MKIFKVYIITKLCTASNILYIGSSFQPSYSLLKNCRTSGHVTVECAYSSPLATGFLIVVQLHDSTRGGSTLYTNKTTNRQTSASVVMENDGTYQVTVFAISRGRGIINSNVEYMATIFSMPVQTIQTGKKNKDD